MQDFLTRDPVTLKDEDVDDIVRRTAVDKKRVEEQKKFYEIARKRAAELDVYMEEYEYPPPQFPICIGPPLLSANNK